MTQTPGVFRRLRTRAPVPPTLAAIPATAQPAEGNAPDRILIAAEHLFAEKGFDISLREITDSAQVNIAAVNYHFGSKANLTEILFDRLSREVNGRRLDEVAAIMATARKAKRRPDLDSIILAFIKPYLEQSDTGRLLARLILQHRIEPSDLTRQIIKTHFDPMAERFIEAFRLAVPGVDPAAFYWRYVFMVGSVVLTITDGGPDSRLSRLSDGAADSRDPEEFQRALLDFLRGGLSAPGLAKAVE